MIGQKSMLSVHPQLNKVGPDLAHLGQSMYILCTYITHTGRVIFEREQGPPWQEVLTQMLEEQDTILGDN